MNNICSSLPTMALQDQHVIVRADLNVPLNNGRIISDFKLKAIQPTLDLILKKGGSICLLTHLGNPEHPDVRLSTKHLIPWFVAQGYPITWASNPDNALMLEKEKTNRLILMENIRFFSGEKNHDRAFAQQLATLGTYYIDDAFGALHRNDTSITLLPSFFSPKQRTIGLLVEKEIEQLNKLIENPRQPFVLVLGGAKIVTKVPLLLHLIDRVSDILLCPAISCTFAKSMGLPVGKSLVDNTMLTMCTQILQQAHAAQLNIQLPSDYQVGQNTIQGARSIVAAPKITAHDVCISIGPQTAEKYTAIITQAQTIFFNGTPGFFEIPETLEGAHALLKAIVHAPGRKIISGGDTIATASYFNLLDHIDHVSTGGGATLAYISGELLPGLRALEN